VAYGHGGSNRPEVIEAGGRHLLPVHPWLIVVGVAVVLFAIWFLRGGPVYTVAPDEAGIVLTFGRYTKTTEPGLHFKWPWPVQTVETPRVAEVRRLEFGFRSSGSGPSAVYRTFSDDRSLLQEAQMLTGDENIIDAAMAIQYRISNPRDYLFNFRPGEIDTALRDLGEAALRQAIGDHPIDDVLIRAKEMMELEVQDKMEELAELYGMGVRVTSVKLQDVQPPREVEAAFKDVATAREERERIINEAKAYEREHIPQAEGEAERMRQEAEGYRDARIAEAEGAVARFQAIAAQYEKAPDVVRARLYLETVGELLPKMKVTVIDKEAGIVNLKALGASSASPLPDVETKAQNERQSSNLFLGRNHE
jgi:modulator of FtsH protease HflK